jgi:hypothetical protein
LREQLIKLYARLIARELLRPSIRPNIRQFLSLNIYRNLIERSKMSKFERMHYALSIAFARGILDGEQLTELLAIYRGYK